MAKPKDENEKGNGKAPLKSKLRNATEAFEEALKDGTMIVMN